MTEPGPHLSPEQRTAFRAFVRDHHPDRGGDAAVFAAGVGRFRAGSSGDDPATGDAGAVGEVPAAPAGPLPFPVRVGVALIRTWRRRHEQPGPS